jgi:hypothetical protein
MSAAAFYAEMAGVVTELLAEFGTTMVIKRTVGKVVDPVTFVVTPGVDEVFNPLGLIKSYKSSQIDGTKIQTGDKVIILNNVIEPLITDTITTETQDWPIVDVVSVKPDDATAVVYFCQVRK